MRAPGIALVLRIQPMQEIRNSPAYLANADAKLRLCCSYLHVILNEVKDQPAARAV
jgi:hypothetical protein